MLAKSLPVQSFFIHQFEGCLCMGSSIYSITVAAWPPISSSKHSDAIQTRHWTDLHALVHLLVMHSTAFSTARHAVQICLQLSTTSLLHPCFCYYSLRCGNLRAWGSQYYESWHGCLHMHAKVSLPQCKCPCTPNYCCVWVPMAYDHAHKCTPVNVMNFVILQLRPQPGDRFLFDLNVGHSTIIWWVTT